MSRPLVPKPPLRDYALVSSVETDLHALLAQRAKRMLAAGTAPPRHPVESVAACLRGSDSASSPIASFKPQRPKGYLLEWDPRALPLLAFAEEEKRRALVRQEAEYWLGLLGVVHISRVEAYFTCRLRELESREEHDGRRVIALEERSGRQVLWSAHEELVVTTQLREIDLPKEEAMAMYVHRASVDPSSAAFTPSLADDQQRDTSSSTLAARCDGPTPSASPETHKNEWILGIVYLITFDLNLQERKERITMLREEHAERHHLGVLRDTHSLISVKSYSDRRHRERCQAYREARARQWSLDLMDEYFVNPLWEEWIQLTDTLIAAALLDRHRLFLRGMSAAVLVCRQHDDRSMFIRNEAWHREVDLEAEWSGDVVRLSAHHYYFLALAIEEEERRVWEACFVPWIASSRSLRHSTNFRLQAALRIQVFVRKVRQGLKGWRVTHRNVGGLVRSKRNREARLQTKERREQQWLSRLAEVEREGGAEVEG